MGFFQQKVPWPVVVGFFAGGFAGCCYEVFSTARPFTRALLRDDLQPPAGYEVAPPPASLRPLAVVAYWKRVDDSILVLREKGAPIDAGRLDRIQQQAREAWSDSAITIDRAELTKLQDQQAAIVRASARPRTGPIMHLRSAAIGGPEHITYIRQVGLLAKNHSDDFDRLVIRVGAAMSQHRLDARSAADNWILRGAMLGMVLGVLIDRIRARRGARPSGHAGDPAVGQ